MLLKVPVPLMSGSLSKYWENWRKCEVTLFGIVSDQDKQTKWTCVRDESQFKTILWVNCSKKLDRKRTWSSFGVHKPSLIVGEVETQVLLFLQINIESPQIQHFLKVNKNQDLQFELNDIPFRNINLIGLNQPFSKTKQIDHFKINSLLWLGFLNIGGKKCVTNKTMV